VLAGLRQTACDFSSLSGTGSTCFALYRAEQKAVAAAKELSGLFRKHQCKGVIAGTFVSR